MSQFADVILPLPLHKYYTYRIPAELKENLSTGSRVIVPFGRKKYYTAIVIFTHNHAPADYETMNLFYGVLNSNFGNGLPDIISVLSAMCIKRHYRRG